LETFLAQLSMHEVMDGVVYWVFFWNLVYVACPPREIFNSPVYDKFLSLVAYYGSMNIRKVTTQLYSVVQQKNGTEDKPKEDK
jgi:hypothetical protein